MSAAALRRFGSRNSQVECSARAEEDAYRQPPGYYSEMPYHPPVSVGADVYHLDHLDPITFQTPSDRLARDVTVWCRFTTHTFSRKPTAGEAANVIDEGRRPRVLCQDRYACSMHLPATVRLLANPQTYVREAASERNWVYETRITLEQASVTCAYHVFFSVRKASRGTPFDVEMTVESAYVLDPGRTPQVRGRMLIAGLLTAIVEGKTPHTKGSRKR